MVIVEASQTGLLIWVPLGVHLVDGIIHCRDLLEQLEARIIFKNGEISLEVKDQQYVELLSLMLITKEIEVASEKENFRKIMDQVFPGVWASNIPGRAKNALPVQIRLKEGGQPVRVKQYPLKNEDIEEVSPIIENFLQLGLLRECQSDFNTPILPVKKPDGSYRLVQDLRAVNKGYKNSPTIFGEQIAKDLESWESPPGEGQLLQYVDDLLIATQTQETCVDRTREYTSVTNIVNPASFLSGGMGEPVTHDCLETIEATYSSRPDLKDTPLEDAETWFTDGSSYVISGRRHAGYAVTTSREVIESGPLPIITSAQKAEIIALIRALELAKGKKINIYMDSRYAFGAVQLTELSRRKEDC
ncbi:hypothetical protein DUI87_02272 [Hirundo rustica rustica]|uniref:RNase H type-1 domain-containing protein n=1 Tax=Hirundo rustica rustica TaxID=333673 RepID=A0A3M0LQR3_HIRRU|nr:hypothetical protein DUI87_02272 [Hirundo rustica rustica]